VAALAALTATAAVGPTGPNTISTFAGTGFAGFDGDGGPARDALLRNPNGVTLDDGGNLYIADSYNFRVRKVGPGGKITTVAGNGRYGETGDGGPATRASLNFVVGLAVDRAGNLYIADPAEDDANYRVRKVSANGTITTFAGGGGPGFSGDGGPAASSRLKAPTAVALDGAGNVYIADTGNGRVRKVGLDGKISTYAGNGQTGFSGDGGPATSAAVTPIGLAADAGGDLFISDTSSRVRKIDPSGTITTIAGNGHSGFSGDGGPATAAKLHDPRGLAVDSAGNVYIADSLNHRVRKVAPSGTITTVAGGRPPYTGEYGPAISARLKAPTGVAVDRKGELYIADPLDNKIRRVGDVSVSGVGGRCSKSNAKRLFVRLHLGNAGYTSHPVFQVICGAFVGHGSRAMVASESIPSCGLTAGWDVFVYSAGTWHFVLHRNNGALLKRVGTGIRETMNILRPHDYHCFPTGGTRSRTWHWTGTRWVATPWKVKRPR
jgi:sugar lactone lactonase YvrE